MTSLAFNIDGLMKRFYLKSACQNNKYKTSSSGRL